MWQRCNKSCTWRSCRIISSAVFYVVVEQVDVWGLDSVSFSYSPRDWLAKNRTPLASLVPAATPLLTSSQMWSLYLDRLWFQLEPVPHCTGHLRRKRTPSSLTTALHFWSCKTVGQKLTGFCSILPLGLWGIGSLWASQCCECTVLAGRNSLWEKGKTIKTQKSEWVRIKKGVKFLYLLLRCANMFISPTHESMCSKCCIENTLFTIAVAESL